MHTYFYNGTLTNQITLDKVESNHAVKVMRSKVGKQLLIINGKGQKGVGEITDANPKKCVVSIASVQSEKEPESKIIVAIAPTKSNDRMAVFLEKATEIGVDEIIPLICTNNERSKINIERWNRVVLAATKQSERFWMPSISEPIKLSDFVGQKFEGNKLIAYCEEKPERSILELTTATKSTIILIGPEGDFTLQEVLDAEQNDFLRCNLGKNRLRTETAGLVAVTLLKNQ